MNDEILDAVFAQKRPETTAPAAIQGNPDIDAILPYHTRIMNQITNANPKGAMMVVQEMRGKQPTVEYTEKGVKKRRWYKDGVPVVEVYNNGVWVKEKK